MGRGRNISFDRKAADASFVLVSGFFRSNPGDSCEASTKRRKQCLYFSVMCT